MSPGSGTVRLLAPAAIILMALAAPLLAPRPPDLQEDPAGARYLPPLTRAHAIRPDRFHVRIVTGLRRTVSGWEFTRSGARQDISADALRGSPAPRFYPLGTDGLGRDLWSRLLFGARHSIGVAGLSVVLAMLLGIAVGSAAALSGGWRDALLMRGVDAIMSVPRLLVYLVCAALFSPSDALLVVVLGATTWTGLARVVRAELMAIRTSDLALGARAVGSPILRLLLRHLLPQMGPVLAVAAALRFADTLLLESALSLLGLGSPPPVVSLGGIIASGQEALGDAWWVVVPPGLLICAIVVVVRRAAAGLFRLADPPSVS